MSKGISELAFFVKSKCNPADTPISYGHCQQLIVSVLGYKSLAAYQADMKLELESVRHFIFDDGQLLDRMIDLNPKVSFEQIQEYIEEAFKTKLPLAVKHYSFEDFAKYLISELQSPIAESDAMNSEIGLTNTDGYEGFYFNQDPNEVAPSIKAGKELLLNGRLAMRIDWERPYSGNEIDFEVRVNINKLAKQLFGGFSFQMVNAKLDQDWSMDPEDYTPTVTLAEAYAELTGISLEDAEKIDYVEPEELTGSSGDMTYGYLIDFSDIDFPDIKAKIQELNSTLVFEEGPGFMENIRG